MFFSFSWALNFFVRSPKSRFAHLPFFFVDFIGWRRVLKKIIQWRLTMTMMGRDSTYYVIAVFAGTGKSVHRPFKRYRRQHRSTKRPNDRVNRVYAHFLVHNHRTVDVAKKGKKRKWKKNTCFPCAHVFASLCRPEPAPLMWCTIFGKHVANPIIMAKEILKYNIVIFIIIRRRRRSSFSCCHRCCRCCCYRCRWCTGAKFTHTYHRTKLTSPVCFSLHFNLVSFRLFHLPFTSPDRAGYNMVCTQFSKGSASASTSDVLHRSHISYSNE